MKDLKDIPECEEKIRDAVENGFSEKCAIPYIVDEICAENALENGKSKSSGRMSRRQIQNVICGGAIYEHPRKVRGWFSRPAAWLVLMREGLPNFFDMLALSPDSFHARMISEICSRDENPVERGARVFFYCAARRPFSHDNAVAARMLSAKAMIAPGLEFFPGNSAGLFLLRSEMDNLLEKMRGMGGSPYAPVFDETLFLWRKARKISLNSASNLVGIWRRAKAVLGGKSEKTLEFYMAAHDDPAVRQISEWGKFEFMDSESAEKALLELEGSGLAEKRKNGYRMVAPPIDGGEKTIYY